MGGAGEPRVGTASYLRVLQWCPNNPGIQTHNHLMAGQPLGHQPPQESEVFPEGESNSGYNDIDHQGKRYMMLCRKLASLLDQSLFNVCYKR